MTKSRRVVHARAPVRVCDVGGWTDTWYYGRGKVTNVAINLYSHVRLQANDLDSVRIHSEDLDLDTQIMDYRKVEYDGVLDLLKAAVKRMGVREGLDVFVRADAPPGCGTGTSASVAVALIGALSAWKREPFLSFQAASLAHAIETEELGLQSGVQDQYASAYGGVLHMDVAYPRVQISRIPVSTATICEWESRCVLVYLGSRQSSDVHLKVIERYQQGNEDTIKAHDQLKELAREMALAFYEGDVNRIAEVMNLNWAAQKRLHPDITNDSIVDLEELARECGASGFKVNGAGGGGSAVVMAGAGREYELKKRLQEASYLVFPCLVNDHGLQVWEGRA
ncbi:MAG: GHMP kinase [Promethearchaeota archaeon]